MELSGCFIETNTYTSIQPGLLDAVFKILCTCWNFSSNECQFKMYYIFLNFRAEFLFPLIFLDFVCGLRLDPLLIVPFSEVCVWQAYFALSNRGCRDHASSSTFVSPICLAQWFILNKYFLLNELVNKMCDREVESSRSWPNDGLFVFQVKALGVYLMLSQKPQKGLSWGVVRLELRQRDTVGGEDKTQVGSKTDS